MFHVPCPIDHDHGQWPRPGQGSRPRKRIGYGHGHGHGHGQGTWTRTWTQTKTKAMTWPLTRTMKRTQGLDMDVSHGNLPAASPAPMPEPLRYRNKVTQSGILGPISDWDDGCHNAVPVLDFLDADVQLWSFPSILYIVSLFAFALIPSSGQLPLFYRLEYIFS